MRYLVLPLAFFLLACGSVETETETETKKSFGDFNVEQAKEWIADTENEIILDVRTDEEVQGGMIEGAIQIDYQKDNFEEEMAKLDTTRPILVYCAAGGRSAKTLEYMKTKGFQRHRRTEGPGDWRAWFHLG